MAETISVQFQNQVNGYNKKEVNEFVQVAEAKLQERANEIANLQQYVADLETRLNSIIGEDSSVEEKLELYDKLMKKMDGDYTNLLAPAVAKAKAIEEKAQNEYDIRIDQARYAADGIYAEAADRIADVVDANMDRMYQLLDRFIYSKTLAGRLEGFVKDCKLLSKKITYKTKKIKRMPKRAIRKIKRRVRNAKRNAQNKAIPKVVAAESAEA